MVVALAVLKKKKKKKMSRTLWVHPILRDRYTNGTFSILYRQLTEDNTKFFNYFRMSLSSYNELFSIVEPFIIKTDTKLRSIPAKVRLAVTLRYANSNINIFVSTFHHFIL